MNRIFCLFTSNCVCGPRSTLGIVIISRYHLDSPASFAPRVTQPRREALLCSEGVIIGRARGSTDTEVERVGEPQ
jgi:hypothetical protein